MIKNYFKIAFRNLWRSKGFSAINISGLAIGMGSAILILLWIQNEMSFDRFYKKSDRLYRMHNRDKFNGELWAWGSTPKIMGPTIKKDYPEVEDAVRFNNVTFLITVGETHLNSRGAFTDSGFLNVFDFPLLRGTTQCLQNPTSIVLTERFAKSLFGNEDPMGKAVRVDSVSIMTVTGVLKDLPPNTSFEFDYLLPWAFMTKLDWDDQFWGNNSVETYTLLKPGASLDGFNAKVKDITTSHSKESEKVFAYPVSQLHLYGKSENGQLVGGRIVMVRLFAVIAGFILLIACINFMNLSTARSEKRAKEVGIRKVVGAYRAALISQFIGESILLALLAFLIALLLVQLSLSSFDLLVGRQLHIDYGSGYLWLFSAVFILFTGLVAGSYPAFYLSAFNPSKVLKGSFKNNTALVTPRKVLVVLQFSFAILLIISTLIIQRQIRFAQDRDTGYNRTNLVYTFAQGEASSHYELIKAELLRSGAVTSVSRSANPITRRWSDSWGFHWEGSTEEDNKLDFTRMGSDADFIKTMGTTLLEGRDIDIHEYPYDTSSLMLNEAAVKAMRLKHPIGTLVSDGSGTKWKVVGVVKDFILESPFDKKVNPTMIQGPREFFQVIHMRLNPANTPRANLAKMEKIFKQYNPQYPFECIFTDEAYARKFQEEQRVGQLAALFAGLTVFISCLGLFGLATYMAENRIREIGVRKVLGASVTGITALLAKDFIKLVLVAFVIASPVAWFTMDIWLDEFGYRITIGWSVFALSGGLAVLIAMLTVSYQAIRAAVANPVKSLRSQ